MGARTFVTLVAGLSLAAGGLLPGGLLPGGSVPARADHAQSGDVSFHLSGDAIVLGNSVVERRWRRDVLATTLLRDKRTGLQPIGPQGEHPDFSLVLDGARVSSDAMPITGIEVTPLPRFGLRVTFSLLAPGVAGVTRTVEAYPGVAGFASRTTVNPLTPVALSGYTLDEVVAGPGVAPTIHAFRAGADWRFDAGWDPLAAGDPHKGDWRVETSRAPGVALEGPGEWLSLASPDDRRLFMVMERRDYASSRMAYDGRVASAVVDLSRDVVYWGPIEEDVHTENPGPGPARHRSLAAGRPIALEPVFTGFGTDRDDEPWQFSRYLARHRLTPYPKAITFNTNNVDANRISTGAKDDVDYAKFLSLLGAAREMGVETFIFDDGWQAASGDWCPDSPGCLEPRAPRFPPRFPDATFEAVRRQLAGDPGTTSDDVALGLWFTPMEFHPRSAAYQRSPSWACAPVGHATAALNLAQPNSSSNEAGIGVWNPEALGIHPDTLEPMRLVDYIEGRIRRAIETYGARYFKFDFLVWIDCAGADPADMYAYHDSFVAMVDRLQAAHPEVTFQVDETNDYRMFPFESVARGPSWFQNGSPESHRLLHNLWNLAPYVPGFSIGQGALGNGTDRAARGVDYLMAVALGSHITFWTEIDAKLTPGERAQVKRWTDFYKANRGSLATFTYPLVADPIDQGWTALQPWDPEAGRGFLLAYRQNAGNPTQRIALRGIPAGQGFTLTALDPATGASTLLPGTYTSASLRTGIDVTIPQTYGYAIIRIDRV